MTLPADSAGSIRFDALGLGDALVKAVTALGYEEPTPIQREAMPLLLTGRDLIGQAGTGTGKTAAFALPMIHRLAGAPRPSSGRPRGLMLVPTRELAMQVAEAIHKYSKKTSLVVVPLYGGAPMDQQIRALRRGADIVVATPAARSITCAARRCSSTRSTCSCSTKPTRCSTWDSPRISRRS